MDFTRISTRWWLAAILVAAVAVRVLYTFGIERGMHDVQPEMQNTDGYHLLARNMLEGHGFRFDVQEAQTVRPPGYPVFLLGIFTIAGVDYSVVQAAQALLGALACWILFQLGRWVLSDNLGLIAAALYALYPNSIVYSARLYTESLYFPLFLGLAYLVCRTALDPTARRGLLTGLVWGAGLLTRGTLMLLPVVLPVLLLLSPAHRGVSRLLRWGVPALLASAVLVVPWTLRNHSLTGAYVPVSTWAWAPMWEGTQVAKHMGEWRDLTNDATVAARDLNNAARGFFIENRPEILRTPRVEVAYDQFAREMVLEDWRDDPKSILARGLAGLGYAWYFTFDTETRLTSLMIHGSIFVLFLTGVLMMWHQHREAFVRAWPALAMILFVNAFHAIAYPHVRYMTPAIALAFLFAALPIQVAMSALGRVLTRRRVVAFDGGAA